MSLPVLLLLVGFAYIVFIGGLSLLKREELSARFAMEAIVITLFFSGMAAWTGASIHPVLLLLVIYLITMRVRLLVDMATTLAKRGNFDLAERLFNFAMRMWPDNPGQMTVRVNQGVAYLQRGDIDNAIGVFQDFLNSTRNTPSGNKLEAAAHYNLGVAYLRQKQDARATVEFNLVVDSWPATEYARRASANLEKRRNGNNKPE